MKEKDQERNANKRILLVYDNSTTEDQSPILGSSPFGLLRIQSYLKKHAVRAEVIAAQDLAEPSALEGLTRDVDIIGFSGLSIHAKQLYDLALSIKRKYPNKIIIGGSEHFALDYQWILSNKGVTGIDVCCTMEGELPLLQLAKGTPLTEIGSVAFQNEHDKIVVNEKYPRLNEKSEDELLRPVPVLKPSKRLSKIVYPEFEGLFSHMGSTQTGTGCIHACDFCTNGPFLGRRYNTTLETAKQEIEALKREGFNFLFFRDAMFNADARHLDEILDHLIDLNDSGDKLYWFSFIGVKRNAQSELFGKMARAGCLMIGVGIEDVIGDRKELGKGEPLNVTTEFVNSAKEHVLVRALMILGLPNHYYLPREEIKQRMLKYMKENPQAAYRINFLTPLFGTKDWNDYNTTLGCDPRTDLSILAKMDTMHNLIDPIKMYTLLEVPEEQRWMTNTHDLVSLRDEIMREYFQSEEHRRFLDSIKYCKSPNAEIMHKIASNFYGQNLKRYEHGN